MEIIQIKSDTQLMGTIFKQKVKCYFLLNDKMKLLSKKFGEND